MTRWRAAAVVAAVVLAGCAGLLPGSGGEPAPTETVTPVPVPATDADAAAGATETRSLSAIPGVVDGFVAPRELIRSHVLALTSRSYTLVARRDVTDATGQLGSVDDAYRWRVAVANNSTYLRVRRGDRTLGLTTTYAEPGGRYVRQRFPNGSVETAPLPPETFEATRQFAEYVTILLLNLLVEGTSVDRVEREGLTYARFYATRPPDLLTSVYDEFVLRNYSATVYVHPDGYVRSIQYEFTLRSQGRFVRVENSYVFRAVGETTVTRPDWVDRAEVDLNNRTTRAGRETTGGRPTGTPPPSASGTTTRESPASASNATATAADG